MRNPFLSFLWVLSHLLGVPAAYAVTCTITGSAFVESLDSYYCDTSPTGGSQNCSGWNEVDLDAGTKFLKYMHVSIRDAQGVWLKDSTTDFRGAYAATVTLPGASCVGQQLTVNFVFRRIHEADVNVPSQRSRFRIVEAQSGSTWQQATTAVLTGPTTAHVKTFVGNANFSSRLANVYYTANSAITEFASWNSNLDEHFAGGSPPPLKILYDIDVDNQPAWADAANWQIYIPASEYNRGQTIRHELGHIVWEALHHRNVSGYCRSYLFGGVSGHMLRGCEWGYTATYEALATFWGIRSLTASDTRVWYCDCVDDSNQDVCSEAAISSQSAERVQGCTGGTFFGVGDTYVTSQSHCAYQRPSGGCNCPDTNGNDLCDGNWHQSNGWRNETQIVRFLWDLIDTNNEGFDDTDLSTYGPGGLVDIFESMPCQAGVYGVDGSCNEAANSAQCLPQSASGSPVVPMTGTRDAYNVYDIAEMVPGDQTALRGGNCVGQAAD